MELSTLRYKWSSQRRPSRNSAYRQVKHSWNMFELLFHCRGEVNLPHTSAERTDFVETAQYLLEECNVPNQYDVSIFSTFCSNIKTAIYEERMEDARQMLSRCVLLDNAERVGHSQFANCAEAIAYGIGSLNSGRDFSETLSNLPYVGEVLTLNQIKHFIKKGS